MITFKKKRQGNLTEYMVRMNKEAAIQILGNMVL